MISRSALNAVLTGVQFAPVASVVAVGVGVLLTRWANAAAVREQADESGTCADGHEERGTCGELSADSQAGARCAGCEGESSRRSGA